MSKQKLTPDVVVRIAKSGNRYNAWDTDGVKRTSEITSGCRKNAFNGNYLLGRFPSPNSKSGYSWRKVSAAIMDEISNLLSNLYVFFSIYNEICCFCCILVILNPNQLSKYTKLVI